MDATLVADLPKQHSISHILLALTLVQGAGPLTIRRLLDRYGLDKLLQGPQEALREVSDVRDRTLLDNVAAVGLSKLLDKAARQLDEAERRHIKVVTYLDPDFPANLRDSRQAPVVLFIRGSIKDDDTRSVAVVGSREASDKGRTRARRLAGMLAEQRFTVVSGLARGIDAAAHKGALAVGGRTLAVVGTGLDRTYPPENADLAEQIAASGALVSQFPFGTPPASRNFPMRNKTMALLSLATVVVEASSTSGAKMQADFALSSESPRRYVFLLQSLIDSQKDTDWPSEFVKRGAHPVKDVEDVVEALDPSSEPPPMKQPQLPL